MVAAKPSSYTVPHLGPHVTRYRRPRRGCSSSWGHSCVMPSKIHDPASILMERTRPKKPAFAVLRPGQERFAMCWVVPMRPAAPLMLTTMRRSMNVAVCAQERSPAAHGKAHMSRVASLFSRRMPLRIWLPIVITCAVFGYVASTLRPPTADQPHTPRSERPSQAPVTSPVDEHEPVMTAGQLSRHRSAARRRGAPRANTRGCRGASATSSGD